MFVIFRVWVLGRRRAVPVLAGRVRGWGVDIVREGEGGVGFGGGRWERGMGNGWALYAGGFGGVGFDSIIIGCLFVYGDKGSQRSGWR